jgi:tRNA (cmo5U34)-methyltransferase
MSGRYFDEHVELTNDYDKIVRTFVPGYDAVQDLIAVMLSEAGDSGHLLVVGAGGGNEIVRLGSALPCWKLTGVDPSEVMLSHARNRIADKKMSDRVRLVQGLSNDAPLGPYDAATALLCLMFAPDDGQRLDQLRAIHARLTPGAPFIMTHAAVTSAQFERDLARYAAFARLRGATEDMLAEATPMQRTGIYILTPEREVELLQQAGFRDIEVFWRANWMHGWGGRA